MAQHLGFQITLAAVGVDDLINPFAGRSMGQHLGHRHGVDGEVASGQVFFEGDARVGLHSKTFVAPGRFALGAGQGVFLACVGMQEHRKVLAHGQVARLDQILRRGAHHHPVAVLHGPAQEGIAHRTADFIHPHQRVFR